MTHFYNFENERRALFVIPPTDLLPYRLVYCVVLCGHCWFFFTLDAGLLARSQYSEGPATGHLDTGFS